MSPTNSALSVIGVHLVLVSASSIVLWEVLGTTHTPDRFYWRLLIYAAVSLAAVVGIIGISARQLASGMSWLSVVPYFCPLLALQLTLTFLLLTGIAAVALWALALLVQPLVCLVSSLCLRVRTRTSADTVSMFVGYSYVVAAVIGWCCVIFSMVRQRHT